MTEHPYRVENGLLTFNQPSSSRTVFSTGQATDAADKQFRRLVEEKYGLEALCRDLQAEVVRLRQQGADQRDEIETLRSWVNDLTKTPQKQQQQTKESRAEHGSGAPEK